jgi:hypothetical protein
MELARRPVSSGTAAPGAAGDEGAEQPDHPARRAARQANAVRLTDRIDVDL